MAAKGPREETLVHALYVVHNHAQRQKKAANRKNMTAVACQCELCIVCRRWLAARERQAATPRGR